jgi:hypothetical protein
MNKNRRLQDEYQFPGYRPKAAIKGIFGDSHAVSIELARSQKKQYVVVAGRNIKPSMTARFDISGICRAEASGYIWNSRCGVFFARSAVR